MTVLQQFIIIGMVVTGDCADTFPALPAFPGRKTYAKIHTVSWKSPSLFHVWPAGHLLPEKCESLYLAATASRNCWQFSL